MRTVFSAFIVGPCCLITDDVEVIVAEIYSNFTDTSRFVELETRWMIHGIFMRNCSVTSKNRGKCFSCNE